ncbi:MAG TPA: hypothetical protein VK871_12500 [Candidatus Limnocylindrales bacterium]|nr:hypothetical protein [Candidatus Limnocylindrales bacterium]
MDPRPGPSGGGVATAIGIGLALVVVALVVYAWTRPFRFYDHFEWQASAFLEGQVAIRYPVHETPDSAGNAFFQDVLPVESNDGIPRGLIPFPPLPAIVLLPFVAAWGRDADGQLIYAILAAIDVAIAWWALGGLPIRRWVRIAATVFFAFGTVFWYAAQIGTTWYQAHVLAVGLALLAVGIAIRADPDSAADEDDLPEPGEAADIDTGGRERGLMGDAFAVVRSGLDRRQFAAGLLFGLACTARLTVAFAAPFFLLVGGGGSWFRRSLSAGIGAAIPVGALLVYNVATTGHVLHPGYDYLYRLEASFYENLGYNLDWAIEDPRYIPQNLGIMLLSTPAIAPDVYPAGLGNGQPLCTEPGAVRGLFDERCPIAMPRDIGMSIFLTSPAYLLGFAALRRYGRSRLVTGAALAVLAVAFFNLMHFSQGWVQFGYRFSNDFVPWALVLVALGLERVRPRWGVALGVALVAVSVAVNWWGVVWGNVLSW